MTEVSAIIILQHYQDQKMALLVWSEDQRLEKSLNLLVTVLLLSRCRPVNFNSCLFVCFPGVTTPGGFVFYNPVAGFSLLVSRFLDHTQRRATVGRIPLDEWSARRRDLYLTTHNTHNRQTSIPLVGFEPTIPTTERPQTHALERAATGTGEFEHCGCIISSVNVCIYIYIYIYIYTPRMWKNYLSICLSVCLSLWLSVCLSVCTSHNCLSVCLYQPQLSFCL